MGLRSINGGLIGFKAGSRVRGWILEIWRTYEMLGVFELLLSEKNELCLVRLKFLELGFELF